MQRGKKTLKQVFGPFRHLAPSLFLLFLSPPYVPMAAVEDKSSITQTAFCSKIGPDQSERPTSSTLTPEEERRLWRKIDIRLIPIPALLYLCSFLDRGEWC